LAGLYQETAQDVWQTPASAREDWIFAKNYLSQSGDGRKLLDLGCYDGRFLTFVGPNWEKFGFEINDNARRLATQAGINVLAGEFDEHADLPTTFDVITAFDVIEHVHRPLDFLRFCLKNLSSDGRLIIATGNTMSMPWKLFGSSNPYCQYPEHLSFLSPEWCHIAARKLSIVVDAVHCYRRSQANLFVRIRELGKVGLYKSSPALFSWLRRSGIGGLTHPANASLPPLWPTAMDHFIVVFRNRRT
jgi:SAM-dependent methyltransferase